MTDEFILTEDAISIEQECESEWHPARRSGHGPGPLYYVLFHCPCGVKTGLTLRCEPWINSCFARSQWVCAGCNTQVKTTEWFTVVGPLKA